MEHPDRIDFDVQSHGTLIFRFRHINGRDCPDGVPDLEPPGFDLDGALAWCEAHGYAVCRWPGGARAWKGRPWPIRTMAQILKRRGQVERDVRAGRLDLGFNYLSLNFAYCM